MGKQRASLCVETTDREHGILIMIVRRSGLFIIDSGTYFGTGKPKKKS